MKNITLKDFSPANIPTQKQVELLAQFMIENFEDNIGGKNGEGTIEMAVRLLIRLKAIESGSIAIVANDLKVDNTKAKN